MNQRTTVVRLVAVAEDGAETPLHGYAVMVTDEARSAIELVYDSPELAHLAASRRKGEWT